MNEYIHFPFDLNPLGRTLLTDRAAHVEQLIRQVLLTNPGERVNRPGLGTELRRMAFTGRRDEFVPAIETMVHGSLQQSLFDLIRVVGVDVRWFEDAVEVVVRYVDLHTSQARTLSIVP